MDYKKLLENNKTLALSGSHALILQGFKLRREPIDIDLFEPQAATEFKGDGSVYKGSDIDLPPSAVDSDVLRTNYIYDGVSVDLFFTCSEKKRENIISNLITVKGVKCVHWKDIIDYKIQYAFDNSNTSEKHRLDLVYFFENNTIVNCYNEIDLPF